MEQRRRGATRARTVGRARRAAVVAIGLVLVACSSSSGGGGSASPTTGATGTTAVAGKGSATKGEAQPGVAGAPAAVSQLSGPISVGLDFKPESDGFSFENYGKAPDRPNLTAAEMQRYFGDSVCASTAGGTCTLSPPAQQWMEATNEGMNGGHCEGMAALALLIKKGNAKASDFGGDLTNALKIDGNEKLAREIAYWFATQALDPTMSAEIKNLRPSEVVDKLRQSFQPGADESYTLGIYKTIDGRKREGHAITPYGLVDLPDGKVEIAIYDNNFPGQARAVVVDTKADTWTYSTATNPAEPVGLYQGDAATFSLTITPTSARLKAQSCPFCGGAAGQAAKGSTKGATAAGGDGAPATGGNGGAGGTGGAGEGGYVFLNDAGDEAGVDLRITAVDGSPLAGLQELDVKGQSSLAQDDAPPTLIVPPGTPFKVTIDGTKVAQRATTDVTFVGPGLDLYIDGINVDPGQVDEAVFDPAKGSITYTTQKDEAPTIGAGFSSDAADYAFSVGGVDLPQGGSVEAALDQASGVFTITNRGAVEGTYAVQLERIDEAGEQTFTDEGFALPAKASVAIDYKDWSSKNDKLKVTVTPGDGGAPVTSELSSDK